MPDFRAFGSPAEGPSLYFIESTAPDNVEERENKQNSPPTGFRIFADPDLAVSEIARQLVPPDPDVEVDLVVMVHGYNTPRDRVLSFYNRAMEALQRDASVIFENPGRKVVCVGYRWPSEPMGGVLGSSLAALPLFPLWLFGAAGVVFALRLLAWIPPFRVWLVDHARLPTPSIQALAVISERIVGLLWAVIWGLPLLAGALLAALAVVVLLRAIVYFRDIYRATNYGVPDLVELIRQIDLEASLLVEAEPIKEGRKRIALSFIGHSMGGLVVTNAIRVLSDVFDPAVIRTTLSGKARSGPASDASEGQADQVTGTLGRVFTLMRFVLASPDIPAETLLADRANFLASSLRRFREAYLFSNEGDEVLRLISTTANYFWFPTEHRRFGYRLGNVEILSSNFKPVSHGGLLSKLRVGSQTLHSLSGDTTRGAAKPALIAEAFTYFDCTDYIDGPKRKGVLTEARNYKKNNAEGQIPYREHIKLLLKYVYPVPRRTYINVHGGYFDGEVTQQLIYRLSCLGFADTEHAYGGRPKMLAACEEHQIRVMLSKRLDLRIHKPREKMQTTSTKTQAPGTILEKEADWRPLPPPPGIIEDGAHLIINGIRVSRRPPGVG
jgi:hypothetical protein